MSRYYSTYTLTGGEIHIYRRVLLTWLSQIDPRISSSLKTSATTPTLQSPHISTIEQLIVRTFSSPGETVELLTERVELGFAFEFQDFIQAQLEQNARIKAANDLFPRGFRDFAVNRDAHFLEQIWHRVVDLGAYRDMPPGAVV